MLNFNKDGEEQLLNKEMEFILQGLTEDIINLSKGLKMCPSGYLAIEIEIDSIPIWNHVLEL